jgi:hypothetical protein
MMEFVSLKQVSRDSKIALLRALEYDSDGVYVMKEGETVRDRYTDENVTVDNMLILPGSTIIIDENPLSIASYFEEFPDVIRSA